ncbi:EamA family transporter [Accumulibacter sp.]|uniref:EamA family transporter n=1 Tax=Accumulibacter sp. TaxID=2053492 RepID=UPI0025E677C5|nr:EamA family transporter [Accumulibacter sp.]MCP5229433.1 EamA family transporter [Accumulibacter sp.]
MTLTNLLLVLTSVSITALGQIALKMGTSNPQIRSAMEGAGLADSYWLMLTSPLVIAGLAAYGVGAMIWLKAISSLDVSQAYPFVALGFVITMTIGILWLGEPVLGNRLLGGALIIVGVTLIGLR